MARPITTTLTPAQARIARAIAFIERSGFPAQVVDLVKDLGLAGYSSLNPTLKIMQRNGYIVIAGGGQLGRNQLIRLTPKGRHAISEGGLPVLGEIRAGPMEEAIAEPETIFDERDLLPHRPGDFLLRVRGDSMIGDGILPGDYVLLRPGVPAAQGEIAAVITDGEKSGAYETTLKRVYQEGETVRLKAGNPAYDEMIFPADCVKIVGVFRGLIRHGRP